MPKESLTDKQEAFCREYVKDWNATQACIRAGYAQKSADSKGIQLIRDSKVLKKINALKEEMITREQSLINKSFRIVEDALDFDPADLYDDDGNLKPVKEMPPRARRLIKEIGKRGVKFPDKLAAALRCFEGLGFLKSFQKKTKTSLALPAT